MAMQDYLSTRLGPYRATVMAALARMEAQEVIPRIWARDHTVWKPEPTEIANRLGWLDAPADMRDKVAGMHELVSAVRQGGLTHAVLLGMGGSSLAAEVLRGHLAPAEMPIDLAILDSTVPGAVLAHAERLEPARTLYLVSTKSGGTVETISFFKFFFNQAAAALGPERAAAHFVAITDPGSGMAQLAQEYGFRATLLNDPEIGGRNAALSCFGLLPAALCGVDLERLLDRALGMVQRCAVERPAAENPAAWLGACLGTLARAGRDKMTLFLSPQIAHFGDWAEQLIAESTGKEGQGIVPVVGEAPAGPAVYGDDRFFVHLEMVGDTTYQAALQGLAAAGHPVIHLRLEDPYDLGGQFFLWQMANAVAGHLLGVNPFDQPDVEAAKVLAREAVASYVETGHMPPAQPSPTTAESLQDFMSSAQPGDYVALQAYLQPTEETTAALQKLRLALRDGLCLATTVGYGPRFLHSTGQLHKGDAGRGLFVQLTADDPRDAAIPDRAGNPASSITFGVLKMAQAMGDQQALRAAGRRVLHLHLGPDAVGSLRRLAGELITSR